MKLQTFLFQMVVTLCISVQYLWKYGFTNSFDNLYAPCILSGHVPFDELDIGGREKEWIRNFGDETSWKSATFNVNSKVDNLTENCEDETYEGVPRNSRTETIAK
jgi:hypothetical protein